MLMRKATEKDIAEWKAVYEKYKDVLKPNKKSGSEIIEYLESQYAVTEIENDEYKQIVKDNIVLNEFSKQKLNGLSPCIKLFKVTDESLLSCQDKVFANTDIIVGVELNISYIFVQGSSKLYDDLFVFAGLDEYDLKNCFLVAQYIKLENSFKGNKK